MNRKLNIAIIGGGASGTIAAIHLLHKLKSEAKVYLIEKRKDTVYRGIAYSSMLEYEPLNVPAGRMSVFNDQPADFLNWLKNEKQVESEAEITEDSFVSRRWFGEYLKGRVETAATQNSNVALELAHGTVHDIEYTTDKNNYEVFLNDNKSIIADYVVFATGNDTPGELFTKPETQLMGNKYVSNPWCGNPFESLKPTDDVLILGTGLTMVDHVISLNKRNHAGKIYAISRRGYLPLPHSESHKKYEFDLRVEQKITLPKLLAEVKKNISKARAQNITWQNALDGLREKTTHIWQALDYDSRKLFVKRLKPFWEIHRHRVPPASLNIIQHMKHLGLLEIISGSIKGVSLSGERIKFSYLAKQDKREASISVDYIINCTGPSENYLAHKNTLLKNLISKGWMRPDDLLPGIKTGIQGEIIQQNGQTLKNAYSIGPMRKPTEWESTAVREIRTQAEKLAALVSSVLVNF